ncbi:MAG: hypothetical protein KKA42_02925 [candidate division Zixibacteria bacterium]|nr:hypothetical protein [candidate division Zixibacteria bacterium]
MRSLLLTVAFALLLQVGATAQDFDGIEPESLIERILATDAEQRAKLHDVVFETELIEYEDGDDGDRGEKARFVKKVYVKYLADTAWFHEEYLEYYKEGEKQSDKDLQSEAKERREKKEKRKARDISHPMLRPFYPERRDLYDIVYKGVASEKIEGYSCHHFRVDAREESDSLIAGDFYFEAETFHLVRVDFSPAKLVKKTMFKLKQLDMSLTCRPSAYGFWLPAEFDVVGKGKAALFIGVSFNMTEYFTNPVINHGIDDSLFEVAYDN